MPETMTKVSMIWTLRGRWWRCQWYEPCEAEHVWWEREQPWREPWLPRSRTCPTPCQSYYCHQHCHHHQHQHQHQRDRQHHHLSPLRPPSLPPHMAIFLFIFIIMIGIKMVKIPWVQKAMVVCVQRCIGTTPGESLSLEMIRNHRQMRPACKG